MTIPYRVHDSDVTLRGNDDGIHILLDQTPELELYLVSSLKQKRKDLHVTLLEHIFLTTGKLVVVLYL
jgi:hypothetical protein